MQKSKKEIIEDLKISSNDVGSSANPIETITTNTNSVICYQPVTKCLVTE